MIGDPLYPRVHGFHLALSLIILFLTVYPYLFNINGKCCQVAAYSSEDLQVRHRSINEFEIIGQENIIISKQISTRSTDEHELPISADLTLDNNQLDAISRTSSQYEQRLQFTSLGQKFDLKLARPTHLISSDFNVAVLDANGKQTHVPFDRNDLQVLEGSLANDSASRATASIDKHNKLLTAQIKLGQDIIIVEPTYLHKDAITSSSETNASITQNLMEKTMIVYKLSAHEQFRANATNKKTMFDLEKLCAAINISNNSFIDDKFMQQRLSPEIEDVFRYYKHGTIKKKSKLRKLSKRGIEFFYDSQLQGSRDRTRCTLHLVADYLFYKHVGNCDKQTTINYLLALINRVNQIYLSSQWETGDERSESFTNIGFTVKNITIHLEYTKISSGDSHYNMQSDKLWSAREYLDNFSRYSPPKHYCLAHLLTYRQFDSPVLGLAYVASTRFGTIGGICSPTQQRGDAFYRHNTGISTSKGIHGETLITRQADLVLAHELGHNLGAEHDSNECRPAPSQGGAYLMHPYAVMGFERNNRFLSNCSRNAIGRVIRRKASTCFVPAVDNVCGNGIVEDSEECDGGDLGHEHRDPCCDSSCRLMPGSQCSDRHSWCCSKCRIVPAGRLCRPAEEFNCKQAAYCDGRSADCVLDGPPVEDNKTCVGRGVCRSGECVPFCEAQDLHSCLCTTPAGACKLCCKTTINSTCVPYNQDAPHLPDGVLCYKGVCEKGRCEQSVQDVVERLWDVIEDVNLTTFMKFLRDNIILVVLVVSIPLWCIITHFINEFDKRIKHDVINSLMKHRSKHRQPPPPTRSPFLPRLFVGDESNSTNSLNDTKDDANQPLKSVFQFPPEPAYTNGSQQSIQPPPHRSNMGFRPPGLGFRLPEGEEVVFEPQESLAMNSIEFPQNRDDVNGTSDGDSNTGATISATDKFNPSGVYSTQV